MGSEIITLKYHNEANLSLLLSGSKLITECVLNNNTDNDWYDIELKIIPTGNYILETSLRIDMLRAHTSVDIKSLELKPSIENLCQLVEGIDTNFYFVIIVKGEEVYKQLYDIRFIPYDYWLGVNQRPELLSMFVQPNMPDVADVTKEAAQILQDNTGNGVLNGYQSCNPNYIREQVSVIYEALYNRNITYVLHPASFENEGQRVRMVDRVLSEHQGNCLDTTLLMASCLESNGLQALVVLFSDHAMLGVRLIANNCLPPVGYDVTYLKNGIADGVNDLMLVETTNLCSTDCDCFEDAVTNGESYLMKHEEDFLMYIDITACRRNGIRPLPQIKKDEEGIWKIVDTEKKKLHKNNEIKEKTHYDELSTDDVEQEQTREKLWERKLLDLTLNNNLVNIHKRKTIIELLMASSNLSDSKNPSSIDMLEDYLSDGKTMALIPAKEVLLASNIEVGDYRKLSKEPIVVNFVSEFMKGHQLLTISEAKELEVSLKEIYRKSKLELEETGTNPLYITIGELVWYESNASERALHAPLILLPVELIRKNLTQYFLRLRDEDVMLNNTIFELIRHDFGIEIPIPDPLPQDDHGVDVRMILSQIRHAIRQMPRWDVEETSYLGTFSFSKFVMWNDIHNNAKKMKENKIVNALTEGRFLDDGSEAELSADAREVDSTVSPAEIALPLSADSSQIEAVMEAAKGKTFVLHGPPGTGKSQTITNMIANALFNGKRVLFVAEKKAALEVVQHRLTQIGLAPFCLELHSNKATKSHFLAQLEQTLELTAEQCPDNYVNEAEKLMQQRQQLSSYINALHNKTKYGISLYDCIESYANHKCKADGETTITISEEDLATLLPLSQNKIDEIKRKFESLDVIMEISGHPHNHPLRDLDIVDTSNAAQVLVLIPGLLQSITRWKEHYNRINNFLNLGTEQEGSLQEMRQLKTLLDKVLAATVFNAELRLLPQQSGVHSLIQSIKNENEQKDELLQLCNDNIFNNNAAKLRDEWQTACNSFFLVRKSRKRKWLEQMQYACPTINETNADRIINKLEQYEKTIRTLSKERDSLQSIAQELTNIIAEQEKTQNELAAFVNTPLFSLTYSEMQATLNRWNENKSMLRDWMHFDEAQHELRAMGVGFMIQYLADENLTGREVAQLFTVSLYKSVAENIINNDRTLNMFNGMIFERKIEEYRILENQFKELTKKELIYRLAQRIPTGIPELPKGAHIKDIDRTTATEEEIIATEMAILKRNIKNHGRGNSIRHIIDLIPTLLGRLCPCMLMSPMSVAQYIDLYGEKFDIVIFDEASQIPTADAVGAVSRGKSLIVVGDPKQMPPTNFFNTNAISEDEADLDDMESILDDCIALSIPSRYLTYHYRSKHESLIAFSNREYYGNKLFTFPSVDNRVSKVTYQAVDGAYDYGHSRCNKAEAEAIVNEVITRLQDEELSKHSIGIVSFSIVQRNLIEDMLTDALQKHKELTPKAFDVDEPIFIKNLENVQGDERDVILFSIGYGPDKDGKVSMNFGPLNNSGGERRLNVAVSRARYEMKIFSTLRSNQIDLQRTNAAGVRGLKAFLEYAEQGSMPIGEVMTRNISYDALRKEIADALRAKGYQVDEEVGQSHFHIDMALVDPKDNRRYNIGIILDGTNYHAVKTVQDREIVQPTVLKALGWHLYHLWAMDWYLNPKKTLQRLLNEIEKDN